MEIRDQRRLAAVVSADVVEYSRLMGVDESGTLIALRAHRRELIDPKIAEHGGRIVKTSGDGLLLEFPSVVDAVRCAVEVQRGMAERNTEVPPDQRIEFRVGINLGDIIVDGDDIFGDGVNVAARLQALAEPGTICVGRAVRDQVLDKLGFAFEDLGKQTVKNIARPIEVFRIRDDGSDGAAVRAAGRRARFRPRSRRGRLLGLTAAVCALGLAGAVAWTLRTSLQRASAAPPFSIAVMPFGAGGGSPQERDLATRLDEDVPTRLGQMMFFQVTSGRKVLDYADRKLDTRSIGKNLDVRYVVEGDVRAKGSSSEVTVRLVEAQSGTDLWSDRMTTDTASTADAARASVRWLGGRIFNAVVDHETQLAVAHPDPSSSLNLTLQQMAAIDHAKTWPQRMATRKFLDAALRIDPDFVPAREHLAALLDNALINELDLSHDTRAKIGEELDALTLGTVKLHDTYVGAWDARADALMHLHRWDQALAANAKARSLSTQDADVDLMAQQAWILSALDRPEEALVVAQAASSIPADPGTGQEGFAIREVCAIQMELGHYAEAVAACERSAAIDDWWLDQAWLAAAYAQLGDAPRAAAAKAALLKLKPDFSIEKLRGKFTGTPDALQRADTHVYAGMRKAGLPE